MKRLVDTYHPETIVSGKRTIRDGSRFNPYFPPPDERDRVIIQDGEVTDTVELMEKVVWKYLDDTKRIAPLLQRSSTIDTCNAIWEFIYKFIQYRLDKRGLEQLRRPARSWAERNEGVDCDCMSIFASSILTNLQIPHSFRITRYSADTWQHVYVIVPLEDSQRYCVIDAVVSKFNYEKPYSDKMDYTMNLQGINVAVLSGVSGNDHFDAVMATSLTGSDLGDPTPQQDLDKLYQNLVATRNAVAQNPRLVSTVDDPQALLKMLDYAIQYWYTDKRDQALEILAKNEQQLNLRNGISTVNGLDFFPNEDIYVLNSGSKNNIPFFQEILTAFNIEHYIIHDTDERLNKNGNINSAWTLNKKIWDYVEKANERKTCLSRRYVHMTNFEIAHNINIVGKDKPLKAYEFVKNITINSDQPCMNYLRDIIEKKEILHNQEFVESF